MPRGFTEQERRQIRERLRLAGREAFQRLGPRRTTVDDLARAAGISKGAFYQFYQSKEALFFDLLDEIGARMQLRAYDLIDRSPADALPAILHLAIRFREQEPLLDLLTSDEAAALLRALSADEAATLLARDVDFAAEIIRRLAAHDLPVATTPKILAGTLRALFFVSLNRAKIDPVGFDGIADLLVESLTAGIGGRGSGARGNRTDLTAGTYALDLAHVHSPTCPHSDQPSAFNPQLPTDD